MLSAKIEEPKSLQKEANFKIFYNDQDFNESSSNVIRLDSSRFQNLKRSIFKLKRIEKNFALFHTEIIIISSK